MSDYVLIGPSLSPWVKRARCFFTEKNVAFEIDPYAPFGAPATPEFLAVSPLGKIPALKHGDFSVAESLAICTYIEKLHPDPPLIPSAPKSAAQALWLCAYADALFSQVEGPLFSQRVLRPALKQEVDEAALAEALEKKPKFLAYLNEQVGADDFLVDNTFSIADITVCAVMVGMQYAKEPLDAGAYPALASLYDRVIARESFQKLLAEDREIFSRLGIEV